MINHVTMQGRFTKDVELKSSEKAEYARFTIAWSRPRGGGQKGAKSDIEDVCYLNCVAFNKKAENISKYFKKGDMAIVEGTLVSREYGEDGKKRYIKELIADEVHFCQGKRRREEEEEDPEQWVGTPFDQAELG